MSKWFRTYLGYMVVGAIGAVWGIPYAIAQSLGRTHWIFLAISLTGGFATSLIVWKYVDPDSDPPATPPQPASTRNAFQLRNQP